ncbi:MAG: ATP-binding protein [candidate division KSB1 bacterium]|nr:ATP-binding protein [candidate division KSB1 bacterium]MDZ7368850.1 ATP-binding protein [candidate division KSB1 bacterium]MDZ7407171.1 ATP-binding protein [candidate division KSB1 bacterium]
MYIPQKQIENLEHLLAPGKVLVLYGARRVGKTTLIKKFIENYLRENPSEASRVLLVNGDDIVVRQFLESQSIQKLKDFVGHHALLVIDEAQYVAQIGLNLKLLVDHVPHLKIIATGSSSFDLAKDIGEPLTGRKYVLKLFPLAQMEISQIEKTHETAANLESRLLWGTYPEAVILADNRRREEFLRELVSSYLLKDILELEGIRHSNKLVQLLQLLAFQIGKEASLNELGTQLGMSKNTVERYLDLLEKVFVIYQLSAFSRNLRKEITKSRRYYFHDLGIRNALIGNFNPLALRNDVGQLWENYIITERLKRQEYLRQFTRFYFWRTYDQKEIDLVEEREGKLFGYEMKWQPQSAKAPKDWQAAYPEAGFEIIHQENYLNFLQ